MDTFEHDLGIEELAAEADVPVRTVRYYIAQGLLAGPGSRGKSAAYSPDHLRRLLLIRRLVDQRVPLAQIREQLHVLSEADVVALLAESQQRTAGLAHAAELSPRAYVAGLLTQPDPLQSAAHLGGGSPTPVHPLADSNTLPTPIEALASPPEYITAPAPVPAKFPVRPSVAPPPAVLAGPLSPPVVYRDQAGSTPSPATAQPEPAETSWQRYRLAPGLELHVEETTASRYKDFIERIRALLAR